MSQRFPRMARLRQIFPAQAAIDLETVIHRELEKLDLQGLKGKSIALAIGSRGISNLEKIISLLVGFFKGRGFSPFIVPAMGSHGGATPEGQTEILAGYGISEPKLGVSVRAAMTVKEIGTTVQGAPVFLSTEALAADGIFVVNRIKPHTDFAGALGSGCLKIMVVGLGKHKGAANYHSASSRLGYETMLREASAVILQRAPIIGGLGIVEDQRHQTAHIQLLSSQRMIEEEEELFQKAKALMPKLPFPEIDLLIVDRIGKNISGSGMDPNIIGRGVHGYSSMLGGERTMTPFVRRIFVRDLTPETHGNAIGIGLADLTTDRLVKGIDHRVMFINSLTSMTPNCAKVPIHFETDREALERGLNSLALDDPGKARVVRIRDTLSLEEVEVSAAYAEEIKSNASLSQQTEFEDLAFDDADNLLSETI